MSCPLVSIIIATFNSEKTIKQALNSVLHQQFQNWECIIVDGKSSDSTISIVEDFEKQDSRFSHISEPDNGVYDAFNKGWKLAKGIWIQYLGSDDKLTPYGIDEMQLEKYSKYSIATGNVYVIKLDGTIKQNLSIGYKGCHQGKFVKRNVIEEMGGFNLNYHILADYDLICRMKAMGKTIVNIPVYVAYFKMGGLSQNIKNIRCFFKEYFLISSKYNPKIIALYYALCNIFHKISSETFRLVKTFISY